MQKNEIIHVRISKEVLDNAESLIKKGLFSNKNEIIRSVIRDIIIKYSILKTKR